MFELGGSIIMKKRKKIGMYTALFVFTTCVSYMMGVHGNYYNERNGEETVKVLPNVTTAGERLIASMLNYKGIAFDADISIDLANGTNLVFDLDGNGKISDINNIQLLSTYTANISGVEMDGEISYFTDTLTFSISDKCHYYLEEADLLSFLKMIPEYGMSLQLPESLTSLNFEQLASRINEIDEKDRKTTDNGKSYFYKFFLGNGEERLPLYVLTDLQDNFLGLRTDTFMHNGTTFNFKVALNEVNFNRPLVNPLTSATIDSKYLNFKPAFQLFDALMKLSQKRQVGALLNIGVDKITAEEVVEVANVDFDINADYETNKYAINALLKQNNHHHNLTFNYINETLFAEFHQVKVKIHETSVAGLIQYALNQMSEAKLTEVMSQIVSIVGNIDIGAITQNVYSAVEQIVLDAEQLGIDINLSSLGIGATFNVTVKFSENEITEVRFNNINYGEYVSTIVLTLRDYKSFTVDASDYVAIEPAATLVQAIMQTLPQKEMRLILDGSVKDHINNINPLTFNGGFQFSLLENLGYGEIDLVDKNDYKHNIKADVVAATNIKFAYNDSLFGKFSSNMLSEMLTLIKEVITNPDEHFMELFGDLIIKLQSSPLTLGINGNYGELLAYDYISNLTVSHTNLEMDVSLGLIGLHDTFHLSVHYYGDEKQQNAYIHSINISNLFINNKEIELNVKVESFDQALNATRLTEIKSEAITEYLDFSNIKTLLELGIKTSRFNYYHFRATVELHIKTALLGLGNNVLHLPLDIQVLNRKGQVQVAIEFINLPINLLTPNNDYGSARNRRASIYWENNTFYTYRCEEARKKGFLGIPYGDYALYEIYGKYDNATFKENALDIILSDILSLSTLLTNNINTNMLNTDSHQPHYEKLLTTFFFDANTNEFQIGINLNELTGQTIFEAGKIVIKSSKETGILEGLDINVTLTVGLRINIKLSLELLDDYIVDVISTNKKLDRLDAHLIEYGSNELNRRFVKYGGALI